MHIEKPGEAEAAEIFADVARWPEKAAIVQTGDEGPVRLPLVLGNPSGACALEEGRRVSPVWSALVAATFKLRDEPDDLELVRDCLLYPKPATWSQWVERWPALPQAAASAIKSKIGLRLAALAEPGEDYQAPAELEAARASSRGSLRIATVGKETAAIVVATPKPAAWRLFVGALRKRDADTWQTVRGFALAAIAGVDGAPSAEAMIARWPGLALVVALQASSLAGLSAEVELGEW